MSVKCYAALDSTSPLVPHTITRRAVATNDVLIEIKFAGICHSDIHSVRNEWGPGMFPMVPGHEIAGVVVSVGESVTKFLVGDHVGVGCMVDSCRTCAMCSNNEEQFCVNGMVGTYNSRYKYSHCPECSTEEGGAITYGGYSQSIVIDQGFVIKIPTNLDLAAASPLLCAGITTYSPIARFGLNSSHKFAVIGLGGLGHMAVKIGVAIGAHVTVISRGTGKKESATTKLGAHAFLDSSNPEEMKSSAGSFDFIINTLSAMHDLNAYIGLLKVGGHMSMVGAPPGPLDLRLFPLIMGRRSISGSLIGGIKETQEMMDFCGTHNIVCDIEMITAAQINEAYERILAADVKYRFVIDISTL